MTPEEISIPDDNLAQIVRDLIDLPESEAFSTENVLLVDTLNLRNSGVENLEGLQYMTNLVYLDCREQNISDVSPISDLTQMTWLSLRETAITDISALQKLDNLLYLNLNRMGTITDISPIAGATQLQELILREVQMGNSGLEIIGSNFLQLYRLNMRSTGVSDLIPLVNLMTNGNLQDSPEQQAILDIRDNQIPNEAGNDGYAPIRPYYENIGDRSPNTLPDPVDPAQEVEFNDPNLEEAVRDALSISEDVVITDQLLLQIDTLNLRSTLVSDLSGIEFMENLMYLDLRSSEVTDISLISELSNLTWLSIRETEVTDIQAISNLTNLIYLNMNRQNGISDIQPLTNLTNLQVLIARDVPFGNEGMELIGDNLLNLWRINMRNTNVSNLESLANLMVNGSLQDTPEQEAVIDIRSNPIPNEVGNDGYAPIRPYYENIGDRSPDTLPDPE